MTEKPDDFEWREDFFRPHWDDQIEQMKDGGDKTEKLAEYLEWVRDNTETHKGVVTEMPDFEEQDYYDKTQASRYMLAFLLGTEYERVDPSPELRDDVDREEVLDGDS